MKLSEQLKQDHECGDFGDALDGYSEIAELLESEIATLKLRIEQLEDDASDAGYEYRELQDRMLD